MKTNVKKAQAALEFLTTYGWAFLVILIMIGALSYFGVLDPSKFLPDKCLFGAGLGSCQEFTVTPGGTGDILFRLINNFGTAITVASTSSVSVTGISSPCTTPLLRHSTGIAPVTAFPITNWNASQSMLFNITGCTIAVGERPNAKVALVYTPQGKSYAKTVEGDISVKRIQ